MYNIFKISMRKFLNNSYLNLLLRLFIGLVFLFSSISKIGIPDEFAKEIANYHIVPNIFINIFAITMPWIELCCALFIILGLRLKSSSFVLAILIAVFNLAIIIAMAKGLNINCGCHTKIMAEQVGFTKLFENTLLILIAVFIYFSKGLKFSIERYIVKDALRNKLKFYNN